MLTDREIAALDGELVHGEIIDPSGTLNHFETDQPLATTQPTLYILDVNTGKELIPADVTSFILESIRYYMNQTAAVTYELYLLEGNSADPVTRYSQVVFDSGAAQADDTIYIVSRGDKLPHIVNLETAGRLYYMLDWSAAPGNTPGFIVVRGRVLA